MEYRQFIYKTERPKNPDGIGNISSSLPDACKQTRIVGRYNPEIEKFSQNKSSFINDSRWTPKHNGISFEF